MAKGKRNRKEQTHLSKFIDQSNYENVVKTMKKRTMDFASLYESKSVYVLTDADEKHMREIEMEQGIVTTPEVQKDINKKKRLDGTIAFKVDPQDVDEDFDDTDDSAQESDEDIITPRTPRTVERKVKKRPRKPMKPFKLLEDFKRPQAANRNSPLYEKHVEWQKEQSTKEWLKNRRLDDRHEMFLLRLDLDAKMNKQTQKISDTVNRIEKEKREEILRKQEKKLRRQREKEHIALMKELKKEAFKKAKEFFCGASLKQNFRAWANYTAYILAHREEVKKKRKRRAIICILVTIVLLLLLVLGWYLYTQIRAQQIASAAKGERRRLLLEATLGRQAGRQYKSRVESNEGTPGIPLRRLRAARRPT